MNALLEYLDLLHNAWEAKLLHAKQIDNILIVSVIVENALISSWHVIYSCSQQLALIAHQ